jgi:hypothetical protein
MASTTPVEDCHDLLTSHALQSLPSDPLTRLTGIYGSGGWDSVPWAGLPASW